MDVIGIGIDIVEVDRIEKIVARDKGDVLHDLFTPVELEYCLQKKRTASVHLAGRFAAKEAYIKALGGNHGLHWTDVEVVNDSDGRPMLNVLNQAKEVAYAHQSQSHFLSIAHERNYAIAMVILCGSSG